MRLLTRLLLVATILALAPLPHAFGSVRAGYVPLSTGDIRIGREASRLAAASPRQALRWLSARPGVSAGLGRDGKTIAVAFRDGALLSILPRFDAHFVHSGVLRTQVRVQDPGAPVKAAVLLPFADELSQPGQPDTGQAEIDALKSAGFTVDVYRNADVSIDLLTHLADYSAIYLETHSGTLGDGDAILDTASMDSKQYSAYLKDGTVRQALAAGSTQLFLAINAEFFQKHVGTFPSSSILYLDGCDVLHADVFWSAVHSRGVDAMLTWDSHVFSGASEAAAQFMFGQLSGGATVSEALAAANAAGYGSGLGDQGIAHLGYVGDGKDSLPRALAHFAPADTPTPTPTDTPTATVTPTPTPSTVAKKSCPRYASRKHGSCVCKKGYRMVHGKCKKVKKRGK